MYIYHHIIVVRRYSNTVGALLTLGFIRSRPSHWVLTENHVTALILKISHDICWFLFPNKKQKKFVKFCSGFITHIIFKYYSIYLSLCLAFTNHYFDSYLI